MKRILVLLLLMVLVGCSTTQSPQKLKILVPEGAPAVAFASVINDGNYSVDVVSGSDNLQASLVNPSSEYDIIVAPINLGAKLIETEATLFRIDSIITWGNLYIVGRSNPVQRIALFGEQAVPGKMINLLEPKIDWLENAEKLWLPSVVEAQAALLAGEVDAALLAEPLASTVIANDESLSVLMDVQDEYRMLTGLKNYPQAAMFVSSDVMIKEVETLRTALSDSLNNLDDLISDIDALSPESLGVASSGQIKRAFTKMNLKVVKASEVGPEIAEYLKNFKIDYTDDFTFQ